MGVWTYNRAPNYKRTSVVADRVSFLSSKTKEIKDSEPEME